MSAETRPDFDLETAAGFVGKYVLIGLSYYDHGGEFVRHEQLHGRIESVDASSGFAVALAGEREGEWYWLPPDLGSFEKAVPGEYRLRSSGEVVVDPDLVMKWEVRLPESE